MKPGARRIHPCKRYCALNLSTRANLNRIFILLVVLSNTFGNFLLADGMNQMPNFSTTSFLSYTTALLSNPYFLSGVALLAVWMGAQLTMFTWADLSYVLPVTASGYVLTALLSKYLLHEYISIGRWAGILLITFGSMLVYNTPTRTIPKPQGAAQ